LRATNSRRTARTPHSIERQFARMAFSAVTFIGRS
jgi:hypothetical protein